MSPTDDIGLGTVGEFSATPPKALFTPPDIGFETRNHWVVAHDGRILAVKPPSGEPPPLTVFLNWTAMMERHVPYFRPQTVPD